MKELKFIRLAGGLIMPSKGHTTDAGFDIYAPKDIELNEGDNFIPTGFKLLIPEGYCAIIYGRSGLALKEGVTCGHHGIIDAGYTGEWLICLNAIIPTLLHKGSRIAQFIIEKVPEFTITEVEEFKEKPLRGDGGFGSTGV